MTQIRHSRDSKVFGFASIKSTRVYGIATRYSTVRKSRDLSFFFFLIKIKRFNFSNCPKTELSSTIMFRFIQLALLFAAATAFTASKPLIRQVSKSRASSLYCFRQKKLFPLTTHCSFCSLTFLAYSFYNCSLHHHDR